ncbi:right-handed parallel beta-helix repeat-containing protein [Streptomyces chumphonensis]|uniref:right-handed parallel beta-helix repeat-containing protein n=1 Tax=Streptomyces chumphonensis TaxID=1214925 RepID=UPI003D74C3E2
MALYTFGGTPADVLTTVTGDAVPDYALRVRVAGTGELVSALYEVDGTTPIGELRTNPSSHSQPGAVRAFRAVDVTEIEYEYLDAQANPVRWYQAAREIAPDALAAAADALPRSTGGTVSGLLTAAAGLAVSGGGTVDELVVTGGLSVDGVPVDPTSATLTGVRIYNPREYGAAGDGVTDDAPAVQDALSAAFGAGGGQVLVPPGEYLLATLPLRIYRNVRLTLMPGARMLRGADGAMLLNGDSEQDLGGYSGHGNILVEGGEWDARGDVFSTSSMCISFGHAENVIIRDTTIRDVCGYHAIELNSTKGGRIENCRFLGFLDPGGRDFSEAVQLDGAFRASVFGAFGPYDHTVCDDIVMRGCHVGASGTPGTVAWPAGVGSHSTTHGHPHTRIAVVENAFDGLAQHAVKAYCWDDLVVARNRIADCGAGIWLRTLDSSKTADRTDENGVDTGLSAPNTGGIIAGNVIRGCTGYDDAIAVEGETSGIWTGVNVSGNVIDGTAGATHGVRMLYADHSVVTGNVLTAIGGTAVSTANCMFVSITANRAHNCGASFITCDAGSDMVIADNHLALCQSHGLWMFGGARIKATDNYVRGAGRADGSGNGVRVTSGLDRLTLTGTTYRAWGSGTEASTAIFISGTVTNVRRFGNDVLGQAATPISDASTSPNLSPYDAGTP